MRPGDVDRLGPAPAAVDVARLVHLLVDAGDHRKVDDRPPANLLPEVGQDQQRPEEGLVGDQVHRITDKPQAEQQGVERRFRGGSQEVVHHAAHHHPGDEVREIGHGLRRLLEAAVNHLVEHQGQQHRRQRQQPQLERRDDQGVAQHHAEVGRLEEVDEVLEAVVECPRTGPDAGEHVVALEGDDDPVQRQVVEEDGGQQRGQDHQVQHVDAAVGPAPPFARQRCGQSPLGEIAHRTIRKRRGGATR